MDAFTGEIRAFGFSYPPQNWLPCDGRELAVNQYQMLFMLIGTTYGGDGRVNFNLPDLRGRVLVGAGQLNTQPGTKLVPDGQTYTLGVKGGTAQVALASTMLPAHQHSVTAAISNTPVGLPAKLSSAPTTASYLTNPLEYQGGSGGNSVTAYTARPADTALHPSAVSTTGTSTPHDNVQPSLGINYCICTFGEFPQHP